DDPAGKIQKDKLIDILLVVIQNDALNNYREIVRFTGLDASFFEIEAFSTIRATMNRETTPVMIFDMGAGATKLYIVEMGIVRTSHTINRGSQDITTALAQSLGITVAEAEKLKRDKGLTAEGNTNVAEAAAIILSYIFAEANRVLVGYQRKSGKVVRRVILTGGGSVLKGILQFAKQNLESEVELADPFAKVDGPAFLQGVLKDAGPQFTVALGVALRRLQELG
ncbi:MAG: pilus assembly protein PilM, partial [Patescibacteria group bacterium]